MIDKKILLFGGAGAVAISIAIAITVNIVINNDNDSGNQLKPLHQLTCAELQQAIDKLARPGFDNLPKSIIDNIDRIRIQRGECHLQGKDWELIADQIERFSAKNEWRKSIGDEITDTTDGQSMLDVKF